MGDGVGIMSGAYIPSRTWFGDNVFVGPGVTFLNDHYPGRISPDPTPRGATIKDDVIIGRGAIGRNSVIAAGAVVASDES